MKTIISNLLHIGKVFIFICLHEGQSATAPFFLTQTYILRIYEPQSISFQIALT